jgi:hypothetical protein
VCKTRASLGGRSSARLERQVVALEVGGSSPLGHPKFEHPQGAWRMRGTEPYAPSLQCASSSMAEQRTLNPQVLGSNPRGRTTKDQVGDGVSPADGLRSCAPVGWSPLDEGTIRRPSSPVANDYSGLYGQSVTDARHGRTSTEIQSADRHGMVRPTTPRFPPPEQQRTPDEQAAVESVRNDAAHAHNPAPGLGRTDRQPPTQ